jgi:hypothetical protein
VHVARRILRHAKIMAADYESGLDMELYEVQMAKLVIYKWQWLSVYNINSVYIYICVFIFKLFMSSYYVILIYISYIYIYYIVLIICDHDQYISLGEVQRRHCDVTLTSLEW